MAPIAVDQRAASPPRVKEVAQTKVGTTNANTTYQSEHFKGYELEREQEYRWNDLKPSFPDVHWEPLQAFTPKPDRALFADKQKKSLFSAAKSVRDLTKTIGTEIEGLKLASLTDAQKDELALLVAERGVVFFRDQLDWTIEEQLELGRYWGKLHKHATTGVPARGDLDEVHVIYSHPHQKPEDKVYRGPQQHSRTDLFHADTSYEVNGLSYTSLKLLVSPPSGGDTIWASGYGAYDRLSYPMREYLEKLTAVHSAVDQAEGARRWGNPVRRDPVETEHPLVRVHPVTGHKALYFNPGFVRYIVSVPKAESDYLINFLSAHVASATDFSVRFKWNDGDVAIWDNRTNVHSAIIEDVGVSRRHAVRVAVQAEVPYFDEKGTSREEEIYRALGYEIDQAVQKGTRRQAGYKD